MQPGRAHKAGLSCVTECVTLGLDSEAVYLCEVCVCRLSKADVRSHIMGSLHRYRYIKAHHPHFVSEWNLSCPCWPGLLWRWLKYWRREKEPGTYSSHPLACHQDLAGAEKSPEPIREASSPVGSISPSNHREPLYHLSGSTSNLRSLLSRLITEPSYGRVRRPGVGTHLAIQRSPLCCGRVSLSNHNSARRRRRVFSMKPSP